MAAALVPVTAHARLARAWKVAAGAGLALFVAHTLVGDRVGYDDFFNR